MPECAVVSTRNPESMTVAERRAEVGRILACGLVRYARIARTRASSPPAESADSRDIALELGEPARLTLVNRLRRAVGKRVGGPSLRGETTGQADGR